MGHCAEFVEVGFYRNISLILMLSRSHMHRLGPVLYPLDVRHVETCREALAASSDCEIGQTFNITLCYHISLARDWPSNYEPNMNRT